jgi:hypothetical protein
MSAPTYDPFIPQPQQYGTTYGVAPQVPPTVNINNYSTSKKRGGMTATTVIVTLFFLVLIGLALTVGTYNLRGELVSRGLSISLIVFASLCIAAVIILPAVQSRY